LPASRACSKPGSPWRRPRDRHHHDKEPCPSRLRKGVPAPWKRNGTLHTSKIWWLAWFNGAGQEQRVSSGSTDEKEARRQLAVKVGQKAAGMIVEAAPTRTWLADLAEMHLHDYRRNRRDTERLQDALGHLVTHFRAKARAQAITTDRVTSYVVNRQAEGAANATVNRELAALKRAFRLGSRAGKVSSVPYIEMLEEDNARQGFFERDQFEAVLGGLPEHLRAMLEVGYVTGWRVESELTTRQWPHVDFDAGWLRLEPGEGKTKEGRMFPLTAELRAVLEQQREHVRTLEQKLGRVIPWLFPDPKTGGKLGSFRKAWGTACLNAGLGEVVGYRPTGRGGKERIIKPFRLPHDLRRTAVRNLERAGVPRSQAMKMTGHKTESVYRRYAIVSEGDLREAGQKLSAHHAQEQAIPRPPVVIPMRQAIDKQAGPGLAGDLERGDLLGGQGRD
jgi:integrase